MIQTTQRNSARLRQDAVDYFFSSFGIALRASGCVSSQKKEPYFIYTRSWIGAKRDKNITRFIACGRENERKSEKGWDETAWNGWNGMLGEMYVCKCSAHTRGCWHSIIILPPLAHETSWSPRRLGVASPAVNFARGVMEYSFDFVFAFVLALLNP